MRPKHAFYQARGYEHLTVADLAHGSFTRDPRLYLRSQKPGVDVQLHRLLAAAAQPGPRQTPQLSHTIPETN